MEKLVYAVWKPQNLTANAFREQLTGPLSEGLLACGLQHLTVCAVDDDVAPAAGYRIENTRPAADGLISLWLDSAGARGPLEETMAGHVARLCGYLVTESQPLVNTAHQAPLGQRTPGMNEVVFMTRPPRLPQEQWLDIWLNSHTQVAIDTQSTFGYRQNVVTRSLTYAAPAYDAIVEENFPAQAMHSRAAFYDAQDDEVLYREREKIMVDSCMRFIDFDKIDCIPMSEYIMK